MRFGWNCPGAIPVTRPLTLTAGEGPLIAKLMSNSAGSSGRSSASSQQIDPAVHDRLERISGREPRWRAHAVLARRELHSKAYHLSAA